MEELISEIVDDLDGELNSEPNYKINVLTKKVESAVKEVISARNYPESYSQEDLINDLRRFYTNIRNIALYDYNQIGAEFQSYSGEGAIFRNYTDRRRLFYGVTHFAVCS